MVVVAKAIIGNSLSFSRGFDDQKEEMKSITFECAVASAAMMRSFFNFLHLHLILS